MERRKTPIRPKTHRANRRGDDVPKTLPKNRTQTYAHTSLSLSCLTRMSRIVCTARFRISNRQRYVHAADPNNSWCQFICMGSMPRCRAYIENVLKHTPHIQQQGQAQTNRQRNERIATAPCVYITIFRRIECILNPTKKKLKLNDTQTRCLENNE